MFEKYTEEVINLRREFHKIPELGYEEFKTSEKIIEYLKFCGIEDIKRLGTTGVTAVIYGNGDTTIGIRADIDALRIEEETELPYSSTHPGRMHACGHDGHIAISLILAKIFAENRASLKGNVKFIFQPAEELDSGAEMMIKEGCMENPKVDYMLSGHLWPDIETGKIDVTYGTTFASDTLIEIEIMGKGGHGSQPEHVKDSIFAGSQIVIALKELSKKFNDQGIKNVLSICSFDCVSSNNIFRDNAHLKGTLRMHDPEGEKIVSQAIRDKVNEILSDNNMQGIGDVKLNYPPLINDKKLTETIREAIDENMKGTLYDFGPVMAAEDFAYYALKVPSVHLKIGTATPRQNMKLHNSKYNINEMSLIVGVKAFYYGVLKLLDK